MRTAPGPRLAELARQAAGGGDSARAAVAEFWAEVSRIGTPLVADTEDPAFRLLTFLWRDEGATDNVVLVGGPARWAPVADDRFDRLPGTDVWHATYRVGTELICRYFLSVNDSLVEPDDETDWDARESGFRADPTNPRRIERPRNPADPTSRPQTESWVALRRPDPDPGAPGQAVPPDEHMLASSELGNSRRIWVHDSDPGTREPRDVVVLLDGWVWSRVLPVSQVVSALRAAGRLDPVVVVMVDALDDDTRCRELEGDVRFVRFLGTELLPWVRERWPVTVDSSRAALVGQSLGGLTAVLASLEAPGLFGSVVSQSGSFWWPRDEQDRPQEQVTAAVAARAPVPTRYWLDVGLLEGEEMIGPNRRMRDALVAAGRSVVYSEPYGGHDWLRWWYGLVSALPWALPARS